MERIALHIPNANVVLAARVRRVIGKEEIERALPALRGRHPMLAVRVELRDGNRASFSSSGVDLPQVSVLSGCEMAQAVSQELQEAFSWERGPMLRLRTIPEEEHTVLIVCAHHAMCDGLSLYYVLRDLVDWVEGGSFTSPEPCMVSLQEAAPTPRASWIERTMMRLMSRKWRGKGIAFGPSDTVELHERFWSEHSIHMLADRLTREETEALLAACRKQSITVGNALTAACLKAQAATQSDSSVAGTTQVTVSFRNRLQPPATGALGFYATRVRVPFEFDTGRTVWQNASSFGSALSKLMPDDKVFSLRRLERLDPGLIDALAFVGGGLCNDPLAKRLLTRMGIDRIFDGLMIANLGLLAQQETSSAGTLDAVYGPFVSSTRTEKYMAAATVDGRLHLSLSYDEATLPSQMASSFFERAIQEIRQLGV
jgi:Phthiocerol/phthiodiolone dimycocerosyl transferase C-terminus